MAPSAKRRQWVEGDDPDTTTHRVGAGRTPPIEDLAGLDEVFEGDDRPIEPVRVPEWGNRTLLLRGLTGAQRDELAVEAQDMKTKDREANLRNYRARLIVNSLVKPDGTQLVPKEQRAAYQVRFGSRSSAAIERLFQVAIKLSAVSDADIKEATEELKDAPSNEPGSD